jgi:hypothetical protein
MSENNTTNDNRNTARKIITPFSEPSAPTTTEGKIITPLSDTRQSFNVGEHKEATITPLPPSDSQRGPSFKYIKHEHNKDPQQVKAQAQAKFEWHVKQAMEQLRGKRVDVLSSDMIEEMTSDSYQKVIAEAKSRLEQEKRATEEEREQRLTKIQERIRESVIDCPDCGQRAGNEALNPYALEQHQKTCAAYAARIRKEQEIRQQSKVHQNRYDRLLRSIDQTMGSMSDIRSTIHELQFSAATARYEKNEAILQAVDRAKAEWQSESEYVRQQKMKRAEEVGKFADAVQEFYHFMNQSKQDSDSEPVWVAGQ